MGCAGSKALSARSSNTTLGRTGASEADPQPRTGSSRAGGMIPLNRREPPESGTGESSALRPRAKLGASSLTTSGTRQSRKKLSPHEVPLAGYLVCRAALGNPVEGQYIPRLQRANDTVQETRARFPYGRGNVATDIVASNHACSQRAQAAHDVFVDLVRDGAARPLLTNPTLVHAAISEFVEGGHCSGHSAVATALHAPKLQPSETVHYVQHNYQGHDWVESRTPEGHDKTVVMDAWAEGPAVFASDSRFAEDIRHTQERLALDADEGKTVPARMAANARYLQENYSSLAEAHLERLKAQDFRCAPSEVWQPQPVVSEAFRAEVKQSLAALEHAPESGALLNKMATESARALGASAKAASASAEEIIAAAYNLGD